MKEEQDVVKEEAPTKKESKTQKYIRIALGLFFVALILLMVYSMAAKKFGW